MVPVGEGAELRDRASCGLRAAVFCGSDSMICTKRAYTSDSSSISEDTFNSRKFTSLLSAAANKAIVSRQGRRSREGAESAIGAKMLSAEEEVEELGEELGRL